MTPKETTPIEWEERLDLIWSRAEMPDYVKDAKQVIKSLFRQALASQRTKLLEEIREGVANLETYTAIDPFKSAGANIAITNAIHKSDVLSLLHEEK